MRISLERAATMLGTSEQMLRRWVEQGAIPCDDTSGECEFDLDTLESWAKRRRLPINRDAVPRASQDRIVAADLHDAMQLGGVHFGLEGGDARTLLSSAVDLLEGQDGFQRPI